MTLGNAAAAHLRLIVWCRDCRHQVEPDPAEMAERYGVETTVPDWSERLLCSRCGSRNVDMVVSGTRGRRLSLPAGERLKYYYTNVENVLKLRRYWTNACRTCALKSRCTTAVQRRITRWEHEHVLEAVQRRLDEDPDGWQAEE
jgi:hypothetical protein